MEKRSDRVKRRLLVPVVLAVSVAGALATVATASGCGGKDKPHVDASIDTPPI
jgi:hypothetical protein